MYVRACVSACAIFKCDIIVVNCPEASGTFTDYSSGNMYRIKCPGFNNSKPQGANSDVSNRL